MKELTSKVYKALNVPEEGKAPFNSEPIQVEISAYYKSQGNLPGPAYSPFIFLSILLEGRETQAIRRMDIIKEVRYLLGNRCPKRIHATIDETLSKLEGQGYLHKRKVDILPKRRAGWHKEYRGIFEVAAGMVAGENKQGQNNIRGRYESHYTIDPMRGSNFLGKLRHGVAKFFGFEIWHNGLFRSGVSKAELLCNARNCYAHRVKTQEGGPSPQYQEGNISNNRSGDGGYPLQDRAEEQALMKLLHCHVPPRRLSRRTRATMRRYGIAAYDTAQELTDPFQARTLQGNPTTPRIPESRP